MKMDTAEALAAAGATGASPEIFQQLGQITRQLHDTMTALGVMPGLQSAADNLPDARSRLTYIAKKTGDAADKVLTSVDRAKAEHESITAQTRAMGQAIVADPVKAVATGAVLNFVKDVEDATARIDAHLTDIMMAQDFHDLTGQVVAKVVKLASDLEASLVKLLLQAAPAEHSSKAAAQLSATEPAPLSSAELNGPVVNPEGRTDIVTNQGEVDDLLASLGF